jgi:hypothetical protein
MIMQTNKPPLPNDQQEKEAALDLFRDGLVDVLQMSEPEDADYIYHFNMTLISLLIDDEKFKQEMERVLYDNKEELTSNTFVLADREMPPTIGNWIKDFLAREGSAMFDQVVMSKYITDSPNVRRLNPEEKERVRKLIRLYRNLKFFPDSMFDRIIADWEIIPVERQESVIPVTLNQPAPAIDNRPPLEQLKDKYNSYRRQRTGLLQLEDRVLVKTKGDIELIKKDFATAVRNNDKQGTIACLMIMARHGALQTALRDNPTWFDAISEYIQKQFAAENKKDEISTAVSNIKLEPGTPAAVSEFLQYILMEKLQLHIDEAALIGVEVGQIMGTAYQGIAFGNQETGHFEWNKNKIENGKIVAEME